MLLKDIAQKLGAELKGDGDLDIVRVANLKTASENEISFLSDPHYRSVLSESKAGAVIVRTEDVPHANCSVLIMKDPYVGFAKVGQLLDTTPAIAEGIHPTAVVEDGAVIGKNVGIGAHAVVRAGAQIGDNAQIGSGVSIGHNCKIGEGTKIYPNACVYHGCEIGSRCTIHSNAVIGSDGFGFANEDGKWIKIPQAGRVIIGDMVEIGSNTSVDRGAIDDTVIGNNVIIDNLCQIAHNVRIGDGTAIAGCTTIAGSVTIGRYCIIGGRSVFNGHITICDGATFTGASNVMRSVDKPGVYSSVIPCQTNKEWRINTVRYMHINDMYHRISTLENELKALKAQKASE